MSVNERIKVVRSDAGMNQSAFGNAIGVSRDTIANIEGCRIVPKDIHIKAVCSAFNVSEEWLRTGDGDMYAPQTDNQVLLEWVNRVMSDQPEAFRRKMAIGLARMSDDGWDHLEKFLDEFLKGNE